LKKIFASVLLITLIIATFSFAMFVTPGVKAQVQEVKVVSYSWYIAPNDTYTAYPGALVVVGEIQNIGSNIIGNLTVVAFAYDSSNNTLSWQSVQVYGSDIPQNGKAPFYIAFQPQFNPDNNRLYWESQVSNVTVYTTLPIDTTETQYSGLTISGTSGTTTITGTVQNTGSQTVGYTWVVATYYDSTDSVVGVGYSVFVSILFHPGASGGFTISPNDATVVSNKITKYSLTVQSLSVAQSATPTPGPSTLTPTPKTSTIITPTPHSSTGPSASSTPPIEISTTLLYAIIIALVAVIFIIVITMFLLLKRRKNAPVSNSPLPQTPPPTPT
jgi:hypothetical protein